MQSDCHGNCDQKVAIISANVGNWDALHGIPPSVLTSLAQHCTDFIMFCDSCNSHTWNVVLPNPPQPFFTWSSMHTCQTSQTRLLSAQWTSVFNTTGVVGNLRKSTRVVNQMRAKYVKTQFHRIDILEQYDVVIWIDSSFQISNKYITIDAIQSLGIADILVHRHSARSSILSEARFTSAVAPRYKEDGGRYIAQIVHYRHKGFRDDIGLYELGLFVARKNMRTTRFLDRWWREIQIWSYQDQLSFPFVLYKSRVKFSASIYGMCRIAAGITTETYAACHYTGARASSNYGLINAARL
jgi:hypothetical protein